MALEKQLVPISFTKGIDTKTDEKQVVLGKLLSLKNARFTSPGKIIKRPGNIQRGDSIDVGNSIGAFQKELMALDGEEVYSLSDSEEIFNPKGKKIACEIDVEPIIQNSNNQSQQDSAYHAGTKLSLFSWFDTQNNESNGVRYSVIDTSTNQSVIYNQLADIDGLYSKCISFDKWLLLLYVTQSGALRYVAIDTTQPQINPSTGVIANDVVLLGLMFDACSFLDRAYICWGVDGANEYKLTYLDSNLVQLTPNQTVSVSGIPGRNNIFADATRNEIWVACSLQGVGLSYFVVDSSLSSVVLAETPINSSYSQETTGYADNGVGTIFHDKDDIVVYKASANSAGVVASDLELVRSVYIYSKLIHRNQKFYLWTYFRSSLQPTYFLIDEEGSVISKLAPSNAATPLEWGGGFSYPLGEFNQIDTNEYQSSYLLADSVEAVNGKIFTQTGVSSCNIIFDNQILNDAIAKNFHMGGGLLSLYDGNNVVEHNFNVYPENLQFTTAPLGGGLTAGSYQYSATYEWTDNYGQVERSTPSVPVTVDLTNHVLNYFGSTASNTTLSNLTGGVSQIYVGMSVVGSGIPANTYVTGILSANSVSISQSASLTASNVFLTFGTPYNFKVSTIRGSNTVTMTQTFGARIYGKYDSGSNDIYIFNTQGIQVGLSVSGSDFPVNTVVTAINGNTVTLNNATTGSSSGTFVDFSNLIGGSRTNGNPTITGVSAADMARVFVGQKFQGSTGIFPANTVVSSFNPGAGTITMNNNAASTGTSFYLFSLYDSAFALYAGQEIVDGSGAIPAGSKITSVNHANGGSFVIDQMTTASSTDIVVNTSDIYAVNITLPTLRLTEKKPPYSKALICVYRTLSDQTIFYKVNLPTDLFDPLVSNIFNDTTVDTLQFFDSEPDTYLEGSELLYTTGGVLENSPMPASNVFANYGNRVIFIPSENKNAWGFSKPVVPGVPVEFVADFIKNVQEIGGELSAIGVLDEKLILFKKENIFVTAGQGPNNTGAGDDFQDAQRIESDVGAVNQKSIVNFQNGIIFKSSKGIYLLDRSLQVSYIGADVAAYNQFDVVSAKLLKSKNEVRFNLSDGTRIVYDYFMNQWEIDEGVSAVDSCFFENQFTYINGAGDVFQEDPSIFTDNGVFIPISLETSWIQMTGIQGFERFYQLLFVGNYHSPHILNFTLDYNFTTEYQHQIQIPVLSDPVLYQYRLFAKNQKCEAFKISLAETEASPLGASFDLSAFTMLVGGKAGAFKLRSKRSFG